MHLNQCMHKRAFSRAERCDTSHTTASKELHELEEVMRGGRKELSLYLSVREALTVRLQECNQEINSCQGKQATNRATQSSTSCNLQDQLKFIKIPRQKLSLRYS